MIRDEELPPKIELVKDHVNMSDVYKQIPVQNQGGCASCYSFPITATIEYLYWKEGINIKLSEQQIIDCARVKDEDQEKNQC